jgi:hypothetical protein
VVRELTIAQLRQVASLRETNSVLSLELEGVREEMERRYTEVARENEGLKGVIEKLEAEKRGLEAEAEGVLPVQQADAMTKGSLDAEALLKLAALEVGYV